MIQLAGFLYEVSVLLCTGTESIIIQLNSIGAGTDGASVKPQTMKASAAGNVAILRKAHIHIHLMLDIFNHNIKGLFFRNDLFRFHTLPLIAF